MHDELVPVAAFGSPTEAKRAQQLLDEAGIPSAIVGEKAIANQHRPGFAGIELRVAEDHAEHALEILEQLDTDPEVPGPTSENEARNHLEEIVTVARFDSPFEAQLALSKLTDAGIRATLADAELVAMDWIISNAIGGIKLQVLRSDLLIAERILNDQANEAPPLERRPRRVGPTTAAITDAPTSAITTESNSAGGWSEDTSVNQREQTVTRAARGALFGLIFPPLQVYVVWLLLEIAGSDQSLRPGYRWQVVFAALVSIPTVLVMVLIAALLFRFALV